MARPVVAWLLAGVAAMTLASAAASEERAVPVRPLPVPTTVSPELRALIAQPIGETWHERPATADAWRALVRTFAADLKKTLPTLIAQQQVRVRRDRLGGVPVFWVEPETLPPENRTRVLLNFHGGAYVFSPGMAAVRDAVLLAGRGFRVVSVDYRMAPDAPYPAAIDDAEAVYHALLDRYAPHRIGVFGSSTGGAMTLALVLRARTQHLAFPGALWAGTPWSELGKVGDSYFANDHVDTALVSYDGLLGAAASLYAGKYDMANPELSPVRGDFADFPPTLLTTGTRDLFLSNTIRVHRKLRAAGVAAELNVYEGLSHGDYEREPGLPESREIYGEAADFFRRTLAR